MFQSREIDSKFFHKLIAVILIIAGLKLFLCTLWIGVTLKKDPQKVMKVLQYDQLMNAVTDMHEKLEATDTASLSDQQKKNFTELEDGLHGLFHQTEAVFYNLLNYLVIGSVLLGSLCLLGGWLIFDCLRMRKDHS